MPQKAAHLKNARINSLFYLFRALLKNSHLAERAKRKYCGIKNAAIHWENRKAAKGRKKVRIVLLYR
jgi:hypothetical protein